MLRAAKIYTALLSIEPDTLAYYASYCYGLLG